MVAAIKRIYANLSLYFKRNFKPLLKICLGLLTSFFVVLFSGSHIYTFDLSSRTKTILTVCAAVLLGACYVLNLKTRPFFGILRERKFVYPTSAFVYTIVLCLWAGISLLTNQKRNENLNGYVGIIFGLCASYALIKSFSLNTLSKWFSNVLSAIAVFSLLIYGFAQLSQLSFATNVSFPQPGYFVQNFLGLSFLGLNSNRLMGPFWEPGVYSTILILGLLNEILLNKKAINWLKIVLFAISIFFTYSTAGWLLFPFVCFVFVNEHFKEKQRTIGLLVFAALAIIGVGIALVIFRDKLFTENASLVTRATSLLYAFKVWLTSPFFGLGPVTARELYFQIAPDIIDASTSTYGYILMSVGLLGILYIVLPLVGCFFLKDFKIGTRVALLLILLGLNFKENQFQILISLAFSLLLIDEIPLFANKPTFDRFGGETIFMRFFAGNNRGVVSNIGYSSLIKVLSVLVGLLNVPVFNSYFGNDSSYGVWLTIVSISTWISVLDLGLSNGLRTKLPSSFKKADKETAKSEISVSFQFSFAIGLSIIVIGSFLAYSLDWNSIYKIDKEAIDTSALQLTMLLVIVSVGLQFSFKTICPIIDSLGFSAVSQLLPFLSNVLLLLFAIFGSRIFSGDMFIPMSSWYIVSTTMPYIVACIVVFLGPLKDCRPSLKIRHEGIKSLIKLNALFFVIQLSNLFLNSINNLLVTSTLGPSYVTDLTKYTKIFTTISSSFSSIIQAPVWVAIAKASKDGNTEKIFKLRKYTWAAGIGICFVIFAIACAMPVVFEIWLGEQQPSFSWPITIVSAFSSILTVLLLCTTIPNNGLEAVKTQAIIYFIAAVLKIPLVLLLKPLLGSYISFAIVLLANDLVLWIYLIAGNIEFKRAINRVKQICRD